MRAETRTGLSLYVVAVVIVLSTFAISWFLAPPVSASSATVANERNVVGIQGAAVVQVTDGNGNIQWEYGNASSYFDVDAGPNGTVLATFAKPSTRCGRFDSPCTRTGVRVISPTSEPRVVYEWTYPVRDLHNSEVHDADRLPSGNIVVAGMEYERVFVLDPDTDKVLWTWNASTHYQEPSDPTRTDWLHINDVDRIGDGRYLVSVRNANQLLVIDRESGVVEVINEGRDTQVISYQHNPQWLGNQTVLVADSGNDRIVELRKDGDEWDVTWTLYSAGGVPFDWVRDADRLRNDNTLITDSGNNRIVEIDEHGRVVASYETPSLPYEADRLPGDERVGGKPYAQSSDAFQRESIEIPVLTRLLTTVRFVTRVPFWVSEIHILTSLVSLGLVIAGTERLLHRQVTVAVEWCDEKLSMMGPLAAVVVRHSAAVMGTLGVWLLLYGVVSPEHTGFKLATGAILLGLTCETVLSSNPPSLAGIRIRRRNQRLGKLLVVAVCLPVAGVLLYSGFVLPGSASLDAGLSLAILIVTARVVHAGEATRE